VGVAENIPVKIRDFLIPVDFVVLDMEVDKKVPLILGDHFSALPRHILMLELEKFNSLSMGLRRNSTSSQKLSSAQ